MAKQKKKPQQPNSSGAKKDSRSPHHMVRIPPDLHDRLKAFSERRKRPLAWELRLLLEWALDKAEQGEGPPL
jgi:hypothetical protein